MTALPTMTAGGGEQHGPEADHARLLDRQPPAACPSENFSSMKSTRMMLLRTMMPAPAMKPIMLVAVKKAPSSPWAGRMPMSDSGMGTRITKGTVKLSNQPTTST